MAARSAAMGWGGVGLGVGGMGGGGMGGMGGMGGWVGFVISTWFPYTGVQKHGYSLHGKDK